MPKSPSACRTVGRNGRDYVECWVTDNEREDPRAVVRSGQGHYRRDNKRNCYDGYAKLQRSTG